MKKISIFAGVTLVSLLTFAGCLGGGYGRMGGYGQGRDWGNMMNYGYGSGGFPTGLISLVFILAVAFLGFYILRSKNTTGPTHDNAVEILKKRYAKGEISKEDFDRMKNDLM